MDTKATISQMSDSDLVQQLKSLKEDVGPITPTSRPLYERRLMKHLILEQASSCTIPYTPPIIDDILQASSDDEHNTAKYIRSPHHINGSVEHIVSSDGDVHSDAADSGVFFGVQLQSQSLG